MADLNEAIDWSAVECLNQQPGHTIQNALKQVGGPRAPRVLQGCVSRLLPPPVPACRSACSAAPSTRRRQAPGLLHASPGPPTPPVCSNHLQGYREDDGLYLESDTDEQLL